jgi:hypothetical protein
MDQPVRASIHLLTASAVKAIVKCASMELPLVPVLSVAILLVLVGSRSSARRRNRDDDRRFGHDARDVHTARSTHRSRAPALRLAPFRLPCGLYQGHIGSSQ